MYSQIEDKFYLIDFGNSRLNKINTPKDTVFAGTPIFMAPEQGGVGTQSDNRTDIYAIGMLMKFMPKIPPIKNQKFAEGLAK